MTAAENGNICEHGFGSDAPIPRCIMCGRFLPAVRDLFCSKECSDREVQEEGRRIEAGWL